MINVDKPLYVASHRLKEGERLGAARTNPDVSKYVINRFIIPPKRQSEQENQLNWLFEEGNALLGIDLDASWSGRTVFLDCRYLFDEFDPILGYDWLTSLFDAAKRVGINAVPVITTDDLLGERKIAYQAVLPENSSLKLVLCIDDLALDTEMIEPINRELASMGLRHDECSVLMDFSGADLSLTDAAADVLVGSLELVQEFGVWHHISFASSSYPVKNPAPVSGLVEIKRHEWMAWKETVNRDKNASRNLVYGDFGADSSKIKFKKQDGSGILPIRHLRYTTADSWLVVRGAGTGDQCADMKVVCKEVVESGLFDNPKFSSVDSLIYQLANNSAGVTAGAAKHWRAMNTERHIAKVVHEIGLMFGISFDEVKPNAIQEQFGLQLLPPDS